MSTLKVTNIQHPSAADPAIELDANGGALIGGQAAYSRNLLYNGAMQVAQRGTSTTGITSSGYYTADRWTLDGATAGTWTQDIQNDAPSGSGLRRSFRMLCTTANNSLSAGSSMQLHQRLEGFDLQRIGKGTASAQNLTLSFWVKSNVTGTYVAELFDGDNNRQVSAAYTISASATWEKKTITFPADTTGAFDNDNGLSLYVVHWLVAGSTFTSGTLNTAWASNTNANRAVGQTNLAAATNNYWQITGVQLEVGPVATPFEFKSYGQELAECQRYYQRVEGGSPRPFALAFSYVTNDYGLAIIYFPVEMRTRPTALEQSGTASHYASAFAGSGVNCDAVPSFSDATTDCIQIRYDTASGHTAGQAGYLYSNNAAAYLAWSAEL